MSGLLNCLFSSSVYTFIFLIQIASSVKYESNWESLDARPLPTWYDEAKFGIFMHWGLYSVPSFSSEWFWWQWKGSNPSQADNDFMHNNYKPNFTYADFGPQFTAEFFNPTRFAKTIKDSGAKYVVLTSKHHEGYTMWPSKYSWNWNSMDVGPKRDIVAELRKGVLSVGGVHFGLYFSQFEWFHPLYKEDKSNKYKTQNYPAMVSLPQMHEIIETYKPDVIWSDGDWEAKDIYWNSTEFLAWLYNDSPVKDTIVTNDRWGSGTACKHGGYYTCSDKYDPGRLQKHKWENCMTTDSSSWGFRRTMVYSDVLSIETLIAKLVRTISCGGNLLLNVGPTHDGRIVPIFEERLNQMGEFLRVNGEAVYATKAWIYQNDSINSNVWYTSKLRNSSGLTPSRMFNPQNEENTIVYAHLLSWPNNSKLTLGDAKPTTKTKVTMLGYKEEIPFIKNNGKVIIDLHDVQWTKLPTLWAWVFKLEYLQTEKHIPKGLLSPENWVKINKKP